MRFNFPNIDPFSFWLGIILATIFWWIMAAFRPAFNQFRESIKEKRATEKEKKERMPSAVEEHYRQGVLQRAQGMHLAAPLFALDELVQPPVLVAPPPRIEPGAPLFAEDIVSLTVPYMPTWPEMATIYHAPTLSLAEALSGNTDIVLTGNTGSGKTVALAYLASRLVRRDAVTGLPDNTLPFLVHVADLDLPLKKPDEPLAPLIEFIADKAPVLDLPRLPEFVRGAFAGKRALLLIDGTDELTPTGLQEVVAYIKAIKKAYPATRIVTTASPEYLDGLVSLNFIPLAMASWGSKQRLAFLEKWTDLWTRYVVVEAWAQTGPEQVDPILLNHWLSVDSAFLSPLEFTLKTWAAYAGDVLGPRPVDAIETHLRRLSPANAPTQAMESLALQVNLSAEPIFDPRKAREWIKSFEPPETIEQAQEPVEAPAKDKKAPKQQPAPSLGLISTMVNSGLLDQHRNNRMRFSHPLFGGYLAGRAMTNRKADAILDQPPWIGKFLSMRYLAAFGDVTPLVATLLEQIDRPLWRNLFLSARWLRDAPRQAPWRGQVMTRLVELLQSEGQPLALRGQAMCAFVLSGDPGAAALFRQFYQSPSGELIQLAALGSGAIQDTKAIDGLSGLLNNPSPVVRRAACLALVSIGTTAALESVAYTLLHGDEDLRRAAAEAMANDPTEGYAMLMDAAVMKDDIMVRRAAVYGLGRIDEAWAGELLTRMQTEDDQWVVRNSAVEVAEARQVMNPHIPRRLVMPSEAPWLIEFAGKQGLGVAPDRPPTDILLMALKSGDEDERLAALSYLRILPEEGVFGALYQVMYSGNPTLREAVYQTVWEMASRGVTIPDPVQFGVGY